MTSWNGLVVPSLPQQEAGLATAMTQYVAPLARQGLGCEDICVELDIRNPEVRREVRRMVLEDHYYGRELVRPWRSKRGVA